MLSLEGRTNLVSLSASSTPSGESVFHQQIIHQICFPASWKGKSPVSFTVAGWELVSDHLSCHILKRVQSVREDLATLSLRPRQLRGKRTPLYLRIYHLREAGKRPRWPRKVDVLYSQRCMKLNKVLTIDNKPFTD